MVLFGWAGSKHKHLDKYSQIYRWVLHQVYQVLRYCTRYIRY